MQRLSTVATYGSRGTLGGTLQRKRRRVLQNKKEMALSSPPAARHACTSAIMPCSSRRAYHLPVKVLLLPGEPFRQGPREPTRRGAAAVVGAPETYAMAALKQEILPRNPACLRARPPRRRPPPVIASARPDETFPPKLKIEFILILPGTVYT